MTTVLLSTPFQECHARTITLAEFPNKRKLPVKVVVTVRNNYGEDCAFVGWECEGCTVVSGIYDIKTALKLAERHAKACKTDAVGDGQSLIPWPEFRA